MGKRITNEVILQEIKKRKLKSKIIFSIIFLVVGVIFFILLIQLTDYIPYTPYTYALDGNSISINNLKIYHSFAENLGNISFKIDHETYPEVNLDFELPVLIDNKSLKIYSKVNDNFVELEEWGEIKESTYPPNHTRLLMFLPDTKEIEYLIEYKMKMFPSGSFIFINPNLLFSGGKPSVAFDLGKDYYCNGPCIGNLKNMVADYDNTDREIRLELERGGDNFHRFDLGAFKDIRIKQSLFLSLTVSSLFAFLIVLKEIFEEIKYKK